MNKENFQQAMEIMSKANIHIAGDFVMEKHVGTEVANVESGGTVNFNGPVEGVKPPTTSTKHENEPTVENKEELFRFIHPSISEEQEWEIHKVVKRLVSRNGIQEICQYLKELKKEKKILLPQSPSIAYAELVRMGMPKGGGFNEITFRKYYRD